MSSPPQGNDIFPPGGVFWGESIGWKWGIPDGLTGIDRYRHVLILQSLHGFFSHLGRYNGY
jgi:hypothetical protein